MTTTVRARLNATIIGVEILESVSCRANPVRQMLPFWAATGAHHRAKGFPVEAEVLELRAAWLRKGLRA